MLFYASRLLCYHYITILSSKYEYDNSKYHISMISLFLFYHYLLKDQILIKNIIDPNIYKWCYRLQRLCYGAIDCNA